MLKFVFLFVALLLFSTVASAAPAYGTKMPEKGKFFGGVGHYVLFDRQLNKEHGRLASQQGHILLSYGVTDWFSLDLKAGSGSITHTAVDGTKTKYAAPLWGGGYGFRIRVFEEGRFKSVVGFQHISTHPRTVKGNGEKNNAILDDWQGSALVSFDVKKFTPYMGVRYGTMDYIHRLNNDADRKLTDEGRRYDAIVGVDIPFGEKVWLNVEGSFGGGEALGTSVNFKF